MTMNELAIHLTVNEGKKKSVSVAQVKELIGLLADHVYQNPGTLEDLLALGRRRAKAASRRRGKAARA